MNTKNTFKDFLRRNEAWGSVKRDEVWSRDTSAGLPPRRLDPLRAIGTIHSLINSVAPES